MLSYIMMKLNGISLINRLNYYLAGTILIFLPAILILFHIANLSGLIPVNIVWTGRIASKNMMLAMGAVSILLNSALIFCAMVKMGIIRNETCQTFVDKLLPFVFWWLVGNTIANLFSKSLFEVIVFTPILVVLTLCCFRIKAKREK